MRNEQLYRLVEAAYGDTAAEPATLGEWQKGLDMLHEAYPEDWPRIDLWQLIRADGNVYDHRGRMILEPVGNTEEQDGNTRDLTRIIYNPWTSQPVEYDCSKITRQQLQAYAQTMDDDIREAIHNDLAPCTDAEFITEYIDRVGPVDAGYVILGS